MRSSRFHSLTPPIRTTGLWRLKTAFSPSSTPSQNGHLGANYPATSSSTDTTSPLSMSVSSYPFDHDGMSSRPGSASSIFTPATTTCASSPEMPSSKMQRSVGVLSSGARLRALLMRGRKPSALDLRFEEEQSMFGEGLNMFEPRPKSDMMIGGIFEVLEGAA